MEIRIRNLNKRFYLKEGTVKAINNVTLTTPANKIITLLGPSGCGKTTLLRCIAGLETPDAGEIMIGKETVWGKGGKICVPPNKRGISMVFQSYAIWPHMNVFGNVAYPLQIQKVPKNEIRSRLRRILEIVGLEGFEDRPATKLSGGQQQRVALARALIAQPKVILFDEPLSNLDAKLRESMRKELRSSLAELAISAVYVTHDRLEALTISDVTAVMRDGVIVEMGTPKEIYFEPEERFVVNFIGNTNFIEGKVVNSDKEYTFVDSPMGRITCKRETGVPGGHNVTVYIRPEAIEVFEGAREEPLNVFKGKVTSLLFAGEFYEAEARVGNTPLALRLPSSSFFEEGSGIDLYIPPARCRILLEKERL